jgi:hypothetical protein
MSIVFIALFAKLFAPFEAKKLDEKIVKRVIQLFQ